MAEEVIKIELGGSGGSAQSLQSLKKEYSELQKELTKTKVGSDEYIQTLKKLGAVKDDIGDLRDTISALNPEGKVAAFAKVGSTIASGFAAAQGAAALFGAESEELQKTMLKVQAAMALAEGIKGITAAGDAFKVLNVIMQANPILAIVAAFTALTAAVGYLYNEYFKAETQAQKLERAHNNLIETNKTLTRQIEKDLDILEAQGAAHSKIIDKKKELMQIQIKEAESNIELRKEKIKEIQLNDTVYEQLIKLSEQSYRKLGLDKMADSQLELLAQNKKERMQEEIDSIKESLITIDKAKHAFHIEEVKLETEKRNESAKTKDEKIKNEKEYLEAYERSLKAQWEAQQKAAEEAKRISDGILKQQHDILMQQGQEQATAADADFLALQNRDAMKKAHHQTTLKERIDAENAHRDELLANENLTEEERVNIIQTSENKIRAEKQKTMETNLDTTKKGLQAAQAITDLVFAHQLRQAKGNAEKEKEIRKKQFNVNKAFGIANAVVDGVGAVQKALNNPYPLNLVLAVISGVLAAANVVKISTTKFDDGGSTSGGSGDLGGSLSTGAAPAVPQPNNTVTKIDDDGKTKKIEQPVVKAVVVETDMTDKQKRVNTIQESAKFG